MLGDSSFILMRKLLIMVVMVEESIAKCQKTLENNTFSSKPNDNRYVDKARTLPSDHFQRMNRC